MEVTKKLTMGTIITLLLAVSGTYFLSQDDNAYYCEDRDMVMVCEKLSKINDFGVQTRCYYEETYKYCGNGWEKIEIGQELKDIPQINSKQYLCNQKECIPI